MNLGEQFNRFLGKTRIVVSRIFIHLQGKEVTPLLGILNQVARDAIAQEGDLEVLGEGLVKICQNLLQLRDYWQSAANEGDVFWDELEAEDYVNELFTDSAQRYLSEIDLSQACSEEELLSLSPTNNLVVMLVVAFEGEAEDIETNLAEREALERALKTLVNLHYSGRLRAIQIHFSPAQLGDQLTDEQLLINFPELIPL
ncbi:MAG: DUF1517 domain-containing protein [Cyanobacteria bacterium J083]|nr:MAG: DUF1517 domain-containing protein [Cyanobacteria bacterium J083]